MNLYLLDTDILTLYQQGDAEVTRNFASRPTADIRVSVVSVEEQLTGWYTRLRRAKKPVELADVYQRLAEAIRFLAGLDVVGFPLPAVLRYEQLRAIYRRIGKNDLRIASIALESGAIVVTRNVADFQAISGLFVEDWSRP